MKALPKSNKRFRSAETVSSDTDDDRRSNRITDYFVKREQSDLEIEALEEEDDAEDWTTMVPGTSGLTATDALQSVPHEVQPLLFDTSPRTSPPREEDIQITSPDLLNDHDRTFDDTIEEEVENRETQVIASSIEIPIQNENQHPTAQPEIIDQSNQESNDLLSSLLAKVESQGNEIETLKKKMEEIQNGRSDNATTTVAVNCHSNVSSSQDSNYRTFQQAINVS